MFHEPRHTTALALGTLLLLGIIGTLWFRFAYHNEPSAALSPTEERQPVVITTPSAHAIIESPLEIRGKARGTWFFEASFPIHLADANGNILATAVAQAQSDWMTTSDVPFAATLTFTRPSSTDGVLIFQKDNPSGLPEYDAAWRMPVRF